MNRFKLNERIAFLNAYKKAIEEELDFTLGMLATLDRYDELIEPQNLDNVEKLKRCLGRKMNEVVVNEFVKHIDSAPVRLPDFGVTRYKTPGDGT